MSSGQEAVSQQFSDAFARVPDEQKALLLEFRRAYPPRQVRVMGERCSYIGGGRGERTLLLLPGALVGADLWFYLFNQLQDEYRLLALDTLPATLSPHQIDAVLCALLDAESVRQATVIGYSAGGGLAQWFVQSHPERVTHLVLSHCTPLDTGAAGRIGVLRWLVRLLPISLIRALFRRRTQHYPPGKWAAFASAYFAEKLVTLDKQTVAHFFEAGGEMARRFVFETDRLEAWPGKILLLSSEDDRTTFPRLPELQARYPRAQVHVFEQGGHHTLLLHPEEYTERVRAFLEAWD
jgi:pimeloyl-ACP methyl ester carboxylesterase